MTTVTPCVMVAVLLVVAASMATAATAAAPAAIRARSGNVTVRTSRVLQNVPTVRLVANDGRPSLAFPLGLCEGDCDQNSDCAGDLICYQRRNRNDTVPGCRGGSDTAADYCVRPPSTTDGDGSSSSSAGGGGGSGSDSSSSSSSSSSSFRLKLYWQEGYYWQEEYFERQWCLACRRRDCTAGMEMMIVECDSSRVVRFRTIDDDNGNQFALQVVGTNLCWTRVDGRYIALRTCDNNDDLQRWRAQSGDIVNGPRFELTPTSAVNLCVTQRHHPKHGEVIHLEPCPTPRNSDTSFWNKY